MGLNRGVRLEHLIHHLSLSFVLLTLHSWRHFHWNPTVNVREKVNLVVGPSCRNWRRLDNLVRSLLGTWLWIEVALLYLKLCVLWSRVFLLLSKFQRIVQLLKKRRWVSPASLSLLIPLHSKIFQFEGYFLWRTCVTKIFDLSWDLLLRFPQVWLVEAVSVFAFFANSSFLPTFRALTLIRAFEQPRHRFDLARWPNLLLLLLRNLPSFLLLRPWPLSGWCDRGSLMDNKLVPLPRLVWILASSLHL